MKEYSKIVGPVASAATGVIAEILIAPAKDREMYEKLISAGQDPVENSKEKAKKCMGNCNGQCKKTKL